MQTVQINPNQASFDSDCASHTHCPALLTCYNPLKIRQKQFSPPLSSQPTHEDAVGRARTSAGSTDDALLPHTPSQTPSLASPTDSFPTYLPTTRSNTGDGRTNNNDSTPRPQTRTPFSTFPTKTPSMSGKGGNRDDDFPSDHPYMRPSKYPSRSPLQEYFPSEAHSSNYLLS